MRAVKVRQILLLTGDLTILYAALVCALLFRYKLADFEFQLRLHAIPMTMIFMVWLVVMYVNGLYDLYNTKVSQSFLKRFSESWLVSVGLAAVLFYFVPYFQIAPRTNLFILSVIFAAFFILWRFIISNRAHGGIRVLAINPTDDLIELLEQLQKNPQLGYHIVGVVAPADRILPPDIKRFPESQPIRAIASEYHINTITVPSLMPDTSSRLNTELYELLFWNIYTIPGTSFFESLTGRVSLSALNDSWFFENIRPTHMPLYETIQRGIDYILSILGLIILGIITPFIALAIRSTSPGPLFYLQERVGKRGKHFKVIKFRTMHALTKDGGAELTGAQITTESDPRVTRAGRIIRRLRIDELPQVINVLKGEMGIIGPRPERPEFVNQFEKHMPYYTIRNLIKPGLTGWAQINYPYAETVEQQLTKFQYDVYYIKNRSLLLDVTVILKTLHVVLYRKGR